MYFISMGKLSIEEVNNIIINKQNLLGDSIEEALRIYMNNQYDSFLTKNNKFIVDNEYDTNIYRYIITIYRISPEYIMLLNRYRGSEHLPAPTPGDIVEITVDDDIPVLEQVLIKYGFEIVRIPIKNELDNAVRITNRAQSFLYSIIKKYNIQFITPSIIPTNIDEVMNPVEYVCKPILGEYNLSHISFIADRRKAISELKDLLCEFDGMEPNQKYYMNIESNDSGIGLIYLSHKDIAENKAYLKNNFNSAWNGLHENTKYEVPLSFNIKDMYYSTLVEHIDASNYINMLSDRSIIHENDITKVYGSGYSPIFIILTDTGSLMSKGIKKVTGSPYNHASISFDSNLNRMYSFSPNKESGKIGFNIENISKSYLDKFGDVKMQMYTVFINQSQLKRVNIYLDSLLANNKAKYNFIGLLGYMINKPLGRDNSKFCSEFVDELFKNIGIDLTHKQSRLVEPYDFAKTKSSTVIKLYEGPMSKLDSNKIDTGMNRIFKDTFLENGIMLEVKKFPIQFDKDGNLIIKNLKKLDLQSEYEDSHRLLMLYDKNNNVDGIKYELSKIWFLNAVLEKELYGKKKPSSVRAKELMNIRARILNDFHTYMSTANKLDKKFNFTEYYDNSPFSDAEIIINKETLGILTSLVKSALI